MYGESKDTANIDVQKPQMTLRSAKTVKLHHKFTKLSKIQKSPYYRGLVLWDGLPEELQKSETKKKFKCLIKKLSVRTNDLISIYIVSLMFV